MATLSTVNVKITGDTGQLVSSLTHAEGRVTSFASKVTNIGTASTAQARGLSNLARGFTNAAGQSGVLNSEISILASSVGNVGLTAATAGIGVGVLAGGLGASIAAAISFESAITKVAKTANFTKEATKAFSEEILTLSRRLPVAMSSLTDIAVVAGQLGIAGASNIARFVEEIAKLQSTTGVGADTLATGLGTLIQVSGLSIDAIENISAALTNLGNTSNSTEQQILDFAVRLVGVGTALGVPLADILSISSSFAAAGVPVERGGTAIQNILIAIDTAAQEAGDELQLFADIAGLTAVEFQKLVDADPGVAFGKFVEGLGDVKNAIPVLEALGIADARIVASALAAANAQAGLLAPMQANRQAAIEGKATNEEFARSMDTTSAQLQLLKNNIQAAAITIGDVFNPAVRSVIEALNDFLDAVRDGSVNAEAAVAGLVLAVTALIAAFGPLAVVPFAVAAIATQIAIMTNDTDTASDAVLNFENAWFGAEIGILGVIHDIENAILTAIIAPLNLAIDALNAVGNAGDFIGVTVKDIATIATEDLGQTIAQKAIAEVQSRIDKNKQEITNNAITSDLQNAEEATRKFSVGRSGTGDREQVIPPGLRGGAGGASGGSVATAVDEMAKAIADGIVDISEAAKLGLSDAQVVALELAEAAKTAQGESFRAKIEFLKLGEVMGKSGLTGESFQLALGLAAIRKHLDETGKSVQQFLLDISTRALETSKAALDGFRSAFDALFSRGTRESIALDLKRAKLERERLGLISGDKEPDNELERNLVELSRQLLERSRVAGPHDPDRLRLEAAIKDLEAEIAQRNDEAQFQPDDSALKKVEEQIAAIDEEIAERRNNIDILRLTSELADKTLLTDKAQLQQSTMLTSAISSQSAEVSKLTGAVFLETMAMLNAGAAATEFATQLRHAAGQFTEMEQDFINAVARGKGEAEPFARSGGSSSGSSSSGGSNRPTEEYYTGPGGERISKEEAHAHPNDPRYKKHVRQLAQGGIVRGPEMALIGEDGPEAVLPLSKPKRMQTILKQIGIPAFAEGFVPASIPDLSRSLTTNETPSIFSQIADVARSLATKVLPFKMPKAEDGLRTLTGEAGESFASGGIIRKHSFTTVAESFTDSQRQIASLVQPAPDIADAVREITTAERAFKLSEIGDVARQASTIAQPVALEAIGDVARELATIVKPFTAPDAQRSLSTVGEPFAASGIPDAIRSLSTTEQPFAASMIPDAVRSLTTQEEPFAPSAVPDAERRLTTQEVPFEAATFPDAVRRLSTIVEPFALADISDAAARVPASPTSTHRLIPDAAPPGLSDSVREITTAVRPFTLSEAGEVSGSVTALGAEGGGEGAAIGAFASGGLVKKHSFIEVGEGDKPELILPLTKPARMSQLLDEAGLLRGRYEYGGMTGTAPTVMQPSNTTSTVNHFHGNIVLPNVRKPDEFGRELDRMFRRGA